MSDLRTCLVAVKTLLSRDPCVHATTAIQMIDAALSEPVRLNAGAVPARVVAGALFDLMGHLTTMKEPVTFSSAHHAGPAVEILREFAKKRGLSLDDPDIQNWSAALSASPAPEPQGVPKAPPLRSGYKRQWVKCRTCSQVAHYDCVPHSLSRPIMTMPCGHGIGEKDMGADSISEEQALAAPEPQPEVWNPAQGMTAHRAIYFMERFKKEEKLLGPNEQAAVDFVLAMLAAAPEPQGLPEPADKPLADWEDPDVQLVYRMLADTEAPPNPEEHWEGYNARRIVAELRAAHPQPPATSRACTAGAQADDSGRSARTQERAEVARGMVERKLPDDVARRHAAGCLSELQKRDAAIHPQAPPRRHHQRTKGHPMNDDRQLISDLLSALEYHAEQTRPIHSTTVAIQAAREHLRTAPAYEAGKADAREWLPIESAPKDGTRIILGSAEGAWMAEYKPVYVSGYRPDDPWFSVMLNREHMGRFPKAKPTHWMPLPPPPEQQK